MYKELILQRKKDFDAVLEHTRTEISGIRTGRANASLVEDIPVAYLGSTLRIKEVATITTPESRVILIQPWDKGALAAIETAIQESSIGLNPVVDSTSVRLTLPQLTEERRKEFIKLLHQKVEESRIRMRQIREDILKKVTAEIREKKARDDDDRRAKEELQKIMDDLNKKFDELTKKKEQELRTS